MSTSLESSPRMENIDSPRQIEINLRWSATKVLVQFRKLNSAATQITLAGS